MEQFRYSRTIGGDEIRLVTIQPAHREEDPVRCRIDTYGREDYPTYEALSYCWGSPDPATRIYVSDAQQGDVQLSVGDGLASALYHLRYSYKPRRIWIDALCIDQLNLDEKALQVASMDTTYKRCSQIVVWLGYASEEHKSVLGVKAINVIGGRCDGLPLRELGAPKPPLPTDIDGYPPQDYLPATQRLLERPWFTRVWTVQEFCLAPRVDFVCGFDTFSLPCYTNLQLSLLSTDEIRNVPEAYGVVRSIQPWLISTRHVLQVTEQEVPDIDPGIGEIRKRTCRLLSHLWHTQGRSCSNPRDRVYGLLQITLDVRESLLPVSYMEPEAQTFTKATRAVIREHEHLDVLSMCHGQPCEHRPSWVPNFGAKLDRTVNLWILVPLIVEKRTNLRYHATADSLISLGMPNDRSHLILSGYHLDTIDAVLGLNWTGGIQLALQLVMSKIGLNSPREKLEAFWRTIIANRRHDSSSVDPAATAESSGFDLWWQGVTELVNPQQVVHGRNEFERWWRAVYTLTTAADKIKEASEYNRAFFQHGAGRVLFTTDSGFVGLSRTTIDVGDQVCLLAGGQTPFVLRSLHDNHQFVSEAYVHGIMDGKSWADLEDSKTERLTFVLV
ncbi:hypothetical protein LTR35_013387 [Friedmanniomyces endolithicus]|nr:hypothetical protein LTR35_013387 [Friedmanniomyces endolithicus]KAK0298127.1 hypothetical protein LTS00_003091 [Friedmanniomyces endolithicus]KAK1015739.1 hypothetical protein LTR54_003467 [Friedmanniomyces endolithicus]